MTVNLLCRALALVCITIFFCRPDIINPQFVDTVASIDQTGSLAGARILAALHWMILGWVWVACLVDMLVTVFKSWRCKKTMLDKSAKV